MHRLCQFATAASTLLIAAGGAAAAPISLTPVSPTYSYDILAAGGGADPNAALVNVKGTGDASYYTTSNNLNGSLTYTVNVAPTANKLNISFTNLLAFGGTGSIVGTYTLDGGAPVTLFNDVTATNTVGPNPGGTVAIIPHSDDITLNPASAHTIVLNYAVNSGNSSNYQEQLFRHDTSNNGGPFVATATFAPEPGSLGILAIGATALMRRRRRGA